MYQLKTTEYDRSVYETELKNFLPGCMVDFHTHISQCDLPRADGGITAWANLVADELPCEKLIETYRTLFPEQTVTPLVFGDVNYRIPEINTYVAKASKKQRFPALMRSSWDMSAQELEENAKQYGFLGLKPYLGDAPSYLPASELRIFDFLPHEHLKAADRNGWIVMLHIPRSKRLRDTVNLAQMLEIEEKYPNAHVVIAHIGRAYTKEDLGDAFTLLRETKHLVFDFTANLFDEATDACLDAVGSERLLFGSDLPIAAMRMYRVTEGGSYINVIPRGLYGDVSDDPHMRETDERDVTLMIYEQLRAFCRVAQKRRMTDAEVENVLYGNAKRILGECGWTL